MTGPFGGIAARSTTRNAHTALRGLMTSVGRGGLVAAAGQPGLLAAVDQHAAAVRDRLRGDHRPLTAVQLADYAQGVRDAAHEDGWPGPSGAPDWSAPDWVLIRLLAVCLLIRDVTGRP